MDPETYYQARIHEDRSLYPDCEPSSLEAMLSLVLTHDTLHARFSREHARYGLSKSTLNVLLILHNGPADGMQLHDLGELMLVSRANITGLNNHLELKGFVRRVVYRENKRARFAQLTPQGDALLNRVVPEHYASICNVWSELAADEKRALMAMLDRVRQRARVGARHRASKSPETEPVMESRDS